MGRCLGWEQVGKVGLELKQVNGAQKGEAWCEVIVGAKMQRWGGRDASEHHGDAVLPRPRACAGTICQLGGARCQGTQKALMRLTQRDRLA